MKPTLLTALSAGLWLVATPASADDPSKVTVDNFVRAESDLYFSNIVKDGGFAKFNHFRDVASVDNQMVIRLNRDTLYSSAVFDLDAGPVTITLPEVGDRFLSMQIITQEHLTPAVIYKSGDHTLTREDIGTRYVVVAIRILADTNDPQDLKKGIALQDQIIVKQPNGPGKFEIQQWDATSQKFVREHLLALNSSLPDTNDMFGSKDEVKPIRHLIGSAAAWGGNPQKEATYLNVTPAKNDGKTLYQLTLKEVPVDGFWSISVYNAEGYYTPNELNAYNLNSLTAKKDADGKVTVLFGGCDKSSQNCLPIVEGWNYMVRLYRPHASILDGRWKFPEAVER